ncbi:MAG: AI-2E family transporter, partial [bacterium]
MTLDRPITITTGTLVKALGLVALALLLFAIRDVLVTIFVALVMSTAIDPSVSALQRRGIPRPAGIAIIFFGILAVVVLLAVLFVPLAIERTQSFAQSMPEIYERTLRQLRRSGNETLVGVIQQGIQVVSQAAGQALRALATRAPDAFGGLLSGLGVLVLTFYMGMQQDEIKRAAVDLAPVRYRPHVVQLARRIKVRLGNWLWGQLLLAFFVGAVTFAGLLILDVEFPFVLALIAGVTEFIPVIGPLIGAVPAILVAVADQPILGVWVAALYLGIQQFENHVLVPRIMASTTGLNPIVVLIAVLI